MLKFVFNFGLGVNHLIIDNKLDNNNDDDDDNVINNNNNNYNNNTNNMSFVILFIEYIIRFLFDHVS